MRVAAEVGENKEPLVKKNWKQNQHLKLRVLGRNIASRAAVMEAAPPRTLTNSSLVSLTSFASAVSTSSQFQDPQFSQTVSFNFESRIRDMTLAIA
jgi:hypothetical protein